MTGKEQLEIERDGWEKYREWTGGGGGGGWHEWLLEHGQEFESTPITMTPYLARLKKDRRRYKARQCFRNAQTLASWDDRGELRYVEGVIYIGDMPIPITHAWNVTKDGAIVDMTIRHENGTKIGGAVMGDVPEGYAYFGVVIDYEDMSKMMLAHGLHASVLDDWLCGFPLITGEKHRDDVEGVA